jgi:hypothetical protein
MDLRLRRTSFQLRSVLLAATCGLAFCLPPVAAAAQGPVADAEYFEKRVRPLFAERCYSCHSASSRPLMGGLRLDDAAGLAKGGRRGRLFTPGRPEESLIVRAVRYSDRALQMPPQGRLAADQVAVVTEWIRRGAYVPPDRKAAGATGGFDLKARARHWAWQPIRHPLPPRVRQTAWVRNPIDAFILAKLEAKGLAPAPPADKRTLIRRVTFDLIGLPPTPAEIHAFLSDTDPHAYVKVVDRLLASPHYGERWARHWLDLVRYAETDGHEWDMEKTGAWQYRDYVIRALNADVPYDRFVREQIAGDLLPHPRLNPAEGFNESVLGTGFFFLGSASHSPVDLLDDQAERIDNQIDVLGKAFLGMGIGCARCHDHKFDAITARDYYALYGFLKATRLQEAPAGRPPSPGALRELEALQARARRTVEQPAASWAASTLRPDSTGLAAQLAAHGADPADILYPLAALYRPSELQSEGAFKVAKDKLARSLRAIAEQAAKHDQGMHWLAPPGAERDDAGWTATGDAFPPAGSETAVSHAAETAADRVAAFGPGVRDSGWLADRLAGTLRTPSFTIDRARLWMRLAGRKGRARVIIDGYQRIRDPIYGGLAFDVDSPAAMRWYDVDVQQWKGHRAYIEFVDDGPGFIAVGSVGLGDGGQPAAAPNALELKLLEDEAIASPAILLDAYRALFRAAGAAPAAVARSADAIAGVELLTWAVNAMPSAAVDERALAACVKQIGAIDAGLAVPAPGIAATDGDGEDEPVHVRGNYRTRGPTARRAFLEVCDRKGPVTTITGSGRLDLVDRMLAPTNPLPARVIVNRLWQHHFGEGIVRTPDDFGVMGERPTHPELLDWLASNFTQSGGWSLKRMHRLMVTSSTYRMSSTGAAAADAADPQDRLLHRMPVRRIEAECVRDAILAVSGRLDHTVGGPPVMPCLNAFTPGRGAPSSGPLDGAGRRSIYISVRRNFLVPMFLAFDYPNPITTIGRRMVSNVPAQALTLLNDPFVVEQAHLWARSALAQPGVSAETRVDALYEAAFGRLPRAQERNAALAFLDSQSHAYGGPADERSWSDLCHVLFNVKEFLFVR